MNLKSLIVPLALLGLAAVPGAAFAQAKVAVANPGRIFQEMQETNELKQTLEAERVSLAAQEKERREEVQKLQAQRNQLKPETPQWDDLNNKLMDAATDFQLWGQRTKLKAERNQKRQMKTLFQRIEQAVQEVAQRDGYDIVIADQRPTLPEDLDSIPYDQVLGRINSRTLLYASPKADISDAVIALLDSKFKTQGGAGAAPAPAPAPARAPAPAAPRKPAAPAPAPK